MLLIAKLHRIGNVNFFQTFLGHTIDCLKILKCYFEKNEKVIEDFCNQWNIDKEIFMRNLFVAVYLHDTGKLTEEFQKNIKEGKRSQHYPHAFYGFPIILEVFAKYFKPFIYHSKLPLIETLTVLAHHTQLYDGIYQDAEIKGVKPLKDEIIEFINKMDDIYRELKFEKFFRLEWNKIDNLSISFKIFEKTKNPQRVILNFIHPGSNTRSMREIVNEIAKNNPNEIFKLKAIYSYFHSILKLCDDYASVEFAEYVKKNKPREEILNSVLENPEKYVLSLPEITEKQILDGNRAYEFQKEIKEKSPGFCFLFAPCGRGKTEAALLWCFGVCKKFNKNKIIFAMPTQTTSNAMRDRFIELLNKAGLNGEEYVGLYHGKSFVKLKTEKLKEREEEDELTDDDIEEISGENFKGNIFFRPITITTIDHLILSFVHGFTQADFALGNLQNSVIVFDEVHYYERQTLKHLVDLFKILRRMQIPHLLMSGTLPDFLIKRVDEEAKQEGIKYELIKDEEGLKYIPFKVRRYGEFLITKNDINGKVIKEIIKNFERGRNQFIILNTVERAQRIFRALREKVDRDKIFLLHSQFTYKDRDKKEEEIVRILKNERRKPIILVSTQVIEISLDISCDVMYTELAPADAIGQRGGRLNRGNKNWKENGKEFVMNVFLPEEFFKEKGIRETPYDFNILQKTNDVLETDIYSYLNLKEICNRVYGMNYIEEFENEWNPQKNGNPLFSGIGMDGIFENTCLFGLSPKQVVFDEETGNGLIIRSEKQQKIEVVPYVYYQNKEENLIVENKTKVPFWWYKIDEKEHGEDNLQWFDYVVKETGRKKKIFWICKLPYDENYGFDTTKLKDTCKSYGFENII